MEENNLQTVPTTPEIPQVKIEKNNNFLVTLLSVLLLISVFIAGFFAYQTQNLVSELTKLQPTSTPIVEATPTPDPTVNWKTYTDNKLNISFKYPEDLTIRMNENGVVEFLDAKDQFAFNFNGIQTLTRNEFNNYKFINPQEFIDLTGRKWKTHIIYTDVYNYEAVFDDSQTIKLLAFQGKTIDIQELANKILSTFKFTEPVACTMEAKICPDGSSVGRSGPKCEFAACPTTKPTATTSPLP